MLVWSYIRWLLSNPGYTTEELKDKFSTVYRRVQDSMESRQSDNTNSSRENTGRVGSFTYSNMEEEKANCDIESHHLSSGGNLGREARNQRTIRRMETPHSNKRRDVYHSSTFRYWSKWDNIKPPRSHHWSMCQRCVLRMDHHCPWIGNWVGFNNHKYFVWFLIYSLNGAIIISGWIIISIILGVAQKDPKSGEIDIHHLIAWVLSTSIGCALFLLLSVHLYMLGANETTIEMGAYGKRNPFDRKDWYSNFQTIFGDDFKTWFIPVPPVNRDCDGVEYAYHLI